MDAAERMRHVVTKRVSAVAVQSLKEALASIFWYKRDLRGFISNCVSDPQLLAVADWDGYKRQIVSDIIDYLCAHQPRCSDDLAVLLDEVAEFDSFRHLEQLDDGAAKATHARQAVADLRKIVRVRGQFTADAKAVEARRKTAASKREKNEAFKSALEKLRQDYLKMLAADSPQQRGFDLEQLLYAVFALFDLDPKASFRITGAQMDGAFSFDGTEFLLEARWQSAPVDGNALDRLASKVKRQLDNTLGLFLSINGFSADGVADHCRSRPVLMLMTGADLMAVLDGRIDLVSLLLRKRQHASRTGRILITVQEILD